MNCRAYIMINGYRASYKSSTDIKLPKDIKFNQISGHVAKVISQLYRGINVSIKNITIL